jgi:hypothetical protein
LFVDWNFHLKIGLYSPYWSTLGGGEKYMLDIARCFPEDEILIIGDNPNLIQDAKNRFGFSHGYIKVITDYKTSIGKLKTENLKNLDVFFYQCDGSVFIPPAKKNILLIQSPVHSPRGTLKNRIKLLFWQKIVCNSSFTASYVKHKTGITPTILNPSVENLLSLKKENIILSVGRFFSHLHSKKQEVLIEVFRKIYDRAYPSEDLENEGHSGQRQNLFPYRLILAGSVSVSDREYLSSLIEQAEGYPIEFQENISFEKIKELYGKAKIYWHAAGFGEDLNLHPERAEHFGISTIEAISAGCYPLVFKGGGQKEIFGNNDDFYWESKEELMEKTQKIINNYELLIKDYEKIRNIPNKYSFENFKQKLSTVIK